MECIYYGKKNSKIAICIRRVFFKHRYYTMRHHEVMPRALHKVTSTGVKRTVPDSGWEHAFPRVLDMHTHTPVQKEVNKWLQF